MPIDSSAYIDKSAIIADSAIIAPRAYIGKNCIIGENVEIGYNAVVECHTEIGDGTILSANAHVGGAPQDIGYKNEDTKLKIGKNCIIREFAPIHRATTKEDWITEIGDGCMIMAQAHVGHDCKVGNEVIVVSGAVLGGHVHVDDYAFISGCSAIHQGVRVGKMAMLAGMSRISQDVLPYSMVSGSTKTVISGLNIVALRRRGVSSEAIKELKKALHTFTDKSILLVDVKEKLKELNQLPEVVEFREFVEFPTKRGIVRS